MSITAPDTQPAARPASPLVLPFGALAAGLVLLGLVFLPEGRAAVGVWIESTAYGHCFLVAPIAAYLVWDRRDSLRGLVPRPNPALLLLGLPLPFAWFAAERLGIMEGRQLVALGFVELLFLVVLGWRLFHALLGPLLYLVFLVPFGAFVTPVLQGFTAHFIDVGLTVLGIPHFSNDMYIEIGAGTFFVAEACAGLRFLIASVAFGVFFALLNYTSPWRRAVFMVASVVVPIVANGFRALGIVVLGQVLGSADAAAADHIIYGWVFFSIVMLLLVAAGLPFREMPLDGPAVTPATPATPGSRSWASLLVAVLAAVAPAAAMALDRNATPAVLAGEPRLLAPEGCQLAPGTAVGHRAVTFIDCGARRWTVTMQAVPARSTGAALADARARLVGELDAETSTVRPLSGLPETAGIWTVAVTQQPPRVVGWSVWLHGTPAPGGLRQRLMQARDSIFGNDVPPLVLAIATDPRQAIGERETTAILAELTRIVTAQPDLAAEIARITAPSSPHPLR